ncbi:MAG: heme NO-binding domain-containing protein [Nanoarchaeota archaeon]|nr:heme NO-binding domain-containing protein [Nanoarchaeota archaeon]
MESGNKQGSIKYDHNIPNQSTKKQYKMMGLICNLLLKFAEEKTDKSTLEEIKNRLGIPEKGFKTEKIYPEDEWQRFLNAIAKTLDVDNDTAEQMFAEYAMSLLPVQFESVFRNSANALDFLRKVPGMLLNLPALTGLATKEKIKMVIDEKNKIVYHYNSPNHLCTFLKSMIKLVFQYYKEYDYCIKGTQCMKDGKNYCEIIITCK